MVEETGESPESSSLELEDDLSNIDNEVPHTKLLYFQSMILVPSKTLNCQGLSNPSLGKRQHISLRLDVPAGQPILSTSQVHPTLILIRGSTLLKRSIQNHPAVFHMIKHTFRDSDRMGRFR